MSVVAYRHCFRIAFGLHRLQAFKSTQSCLATYNHILKYSHPLSSTVMSRNMSKFIPAPPVPPAIIESAPEISQTLNALGEPTLSSLGLASWYPSGLVQYGLETIHVGLDVPWWTAIVIGTMILRVATFPLAIFAQRNSASFHNHMPVIQKMQAKFQKAKRSNNTMETAKAATNLYHYMKDNEVKPFRNFLVPCIQLPIFVSVFVGIRQMTNLPVESMTTGGMAWFMDLTTPDPYFALPVITMLTFLATIEAGVDGVKAASMSKTMRMVMRALPVIILPFSINFPAGLLMYWVTSNGVSLTQALLMRINGVKNFLQIPAMVKHSPQNPSEKVPFLQEMKNTWRKSKKVVDLEEHQRIEAVRFKEAGMGAVPKTYSYDPTKK